MLIEYDVGECRTGVTNDEQLTALVKAIRQCRHVALKGIFSHEGHTYNADNLADCCEKAEEAYRRTVRAAQIIRGLGVDIDTVSIGATPSVMNGSRFEGITELRLGTYIFFDAGQSNAIGDYSHCAATVLGTVISKPEGNRVVLDTGAKALVRKAARRDSAPQTGSAASKGPNGFRVVRLYDEHGIVCDDEFWASVEIGDKVEIIPSHICPTVNLYDCAYWSQRGRCSKGSRFLPRARSQ